MPEDAGLSRPSNPASTEEEDIKSRYAKVLGSAVNPVLREGNSDRRVAKPVKDYARKNPHKVGKWTPDSKSHVHSMKDGDFFSSEKSFVNGSDPDSVQIVLEGTDGSYFLNTSRFLDHGYGRIGLDHCWRI